MKKSSWPHAIIAHNKLLDYCHSTHLVLFIRTQSNSPRTDQLFYSYKFYLYQNVYMYIIYICAMYICIYVYNIYIYISCRHVFHPSQDSSVLLRSTSTCYVIFKVICSLVKQNVVCRLGVVTWLYVLVMSHPHFRVNPHSIVAWMSSLAKSLSVPLRFNWLRVRVQLQ